MNDIIIMYICYILQTAIKQKIKVMHDCTSLLSRLSLFKGLCNMIGIILIVKPVGMDLACNSSEVT